MEIIFDILIHIFHWGIECILNLTWWEALIGLAIGVALAS